MIVVADTSPINYLLQIDEIELLRLLYERVLIPQAVLLELQHLKTPPVVRSWAEAPPDWLDVRSASNLDASGLFELDRGEREAIALALHLRADRILVDERQGTVAAERVGLAVTGTLGILRDAHRARLVDGLEAYGRLKSETNFRHTKHVAQNFFTSLGLSR